MNFSAIIAAGIMGLATLASQSEAFHVRFKPVAHQQQQTERQATQVSNQIQSLEIDRIAFTTERARAFSQFTPRTSSEFRRGEEFHIYLEPRALVTRYEEGHIRASVTIDIEIRNEAGNVIVDERGAWKLPIAVKAPSHLPLSQLFGAVSTNPVNLPAGNYTFKLRIHDDFGGFSTERQVRITMTDAQASR